MSKLFWIMIALLGFLLFMLLIIFTKLSILLHYYHFNDDDDLKIELRIWFGLIRYKIHVPLVKLDENSPSIVTKSQTYAGEAEKEAKVTKEKKYFKSDFIKISQKIKELLSRIVGFYTIVKSFLKHVKIKEWHWDTVIGLGDAAHTGMIAGALWGIKGSIIGLVSRYLTLKETPQISIIPEFQRAVIQTRFQCMIQFRIGHAILAGLKMVKYWRGTKPHLKSKPEVSNEKMKSI